MERYFISVENAVTNLIACSLFKAGVYVFNMGEPVKIMEVAKKFSSNIKIIGLRKGEKIKEKLYYDFESKVFTENQNIFNINTVVDKKDKEDISLLVENSLGMNKEQILNQFKQINNERNS
jgi:FlaA1/EpsC-like NDP-sugar epimerase